MPTTRRDFVRRTAAAAAGAVAGIPLPGAGQPLSAEAAGLKWDKAPCRFCGTGCGVNVAVKNNRVVATRGDADAEVNKGLTASRATSCPRSCTARTG